MSNQSKNIQKILESVKGPSILQIGIEYNALTGNLRYSAPPDNILALGMIEVVKANMFAEIARMKLLGVVQPPAKQPAEQPPTDKAAVPQEADQTQFVHGLKSQAYQAMYCGITAHKYPDIKAGQGAAVTCPLCLAKMAEEGILKPSAPEAATPAAGKTE